MVLRPQSQGADGHGSSSGRQTRPGRQYITDHIKEGHALDYGPKVLPLIKILVDTKLVFTSVMSQYDKFQ